MECIEARALKSSFLSQMAMKTNYSQGFYSNDDVWCLAGINTVAPEDFPVEDLLNLDFPDKEFLQEASSFQTDDETHVTTHTNNSSSTFSGTDDFDCLSAGELSVPVDELENLEWLSQFVDDSTSELSLLYPAGSFTEKTGVHSVNRTEPVSRPVQKIHVPCFPSPVPGKARSKRSRGSRQTWPVASLPPGTTESSSTTSSSSYGSSTLPPVLFTNVVQDADWFSSVEKPVSKKLKRKTDANANTDAGLVSGRRCTHCQVQKTPQWRTGPLGPKTLCNACGVRYKSGRLFPEYRPACSPTFSQEVHSNSHRKVLEMRRKKEMVQVAGPEPGWTQAVQSF